MLIEFWLIKNINCFVWYFPGQIYSFKKSIPNLCNINKKANAGKIPALVYIE